jgi:hypothetical protein
MARIASAGEEEKVKTENKTGAEEIADAIRESMMPPTAEPNGCRDCGGQPKIYYKGPEHYDLFHSCRQGEYYIEFPKNFATRGEAVAAWNTLNPSNKPADRSSLLIADGWDLRGKI